MRTYLLLAALLLPALSSADPVRTETDADTTVFTDADGAHVVTLIDVHGLVFKLPGLNEKELGNTKRHHGYIKPPYWVRTRVADGRVICEKFAERPAKPEDIEARAAELLKESCP